MSSKITGKEYPINKIFSKEFDYYIPEYQRPYAWTKEETETLFDDLLDFFNSEKEDNYFLGSIVLVKEEGKPQAKVIDGQQRLTTLSILIAAIASMLYGNIRDNCCSYLYEPGNELEGLKPMPRLHLRAKDNDFFNKYIQNLKLSELIALNSKDLPNESQMHIKENCALLLQKIKSTFGNDETKIANFCRFLVTRCYLVTVCTDSEQSAFRIFSVMNSRGLNLMPIDIIKSKVIGQIDIDNRQKYTDKWKELEIMTSRSGFNDVFTHTRMIYAKTKSKLNLLEEFENHVLLKVTPEQLIDDILTPYAEVYKLLKSKKYISDKK